MEPGFNTRPVNLAFTQERFDVAIGERNFGSSPVSVVDHAA